MTHYQRYHCMQSAGNFEKDLVTIYVIYINESMITTSH